VTDEQTQALNQDISERMRRELGTLVQNVIVLQAQNAYLMREVERLSHLRTTENETSDTPYPVSRAG
jgi:hypothetical protein